MRAEPHDAHGGHALDEHEDGKDQSEEPEDALCGIGEGLVGGGEPLLLILDAGEGPYHPDTAEFLAHDLVYAVDARLDASEQGECLPKHHEQEDEHHRQDDRQ
jgi:hypothetical protein